MYEKPLCVFHFPELSARKVPLMVCGTSQHDEEDKSSIQTPEVLSKVIKVEVLPDIY